MLWSKIFGATLDQNAHAMSTDAAGNVLVTGSYQNEIDFGGGPLPYSPFNQAFAGSLHPTGDYHWGKGLVTAPPGSYGNGVAIDASGNGLVAGSFCGTVDFGGGPLTSAGSSNIFVAKYGPDGSFLWAKRYGEAGGDGGAYKLTTDAAGNVIVPATYSTGAVDFGCGALPPGGGYDALIAKLDPAGNCLWSKRFGDMSLQQATVAAVDASNDVIFAGRLDGTADFGGGPLTSAGGADVFVVKLDPAGNYLWARRYGDPQDQVCVAAAVDASGDVVIGGWFSGTLTFGTNPPLACAGGVDGFVAKLDPSGTALWSKRFGAVGSDEVEGVAVDAQGNVCITGYFNDTVDLGNGPLTSAGQSDVVVAKYNGGGTPLWSKRFGDPQAQWGVDVGVDSSGYLYVTGVVSGSIDFGQGTLTSTGGTDTFVAKLGP
jgi:hypothetical protein